MRVIQDCVGVHGIGHEHRRGHCIRRYMHVLDLIASRGIKESINENDGSRFLEVIQQAAFLLICDDRQWSPEVVRKVFPIPRGLALEDRCNILFGYDPGSVCCHTTPLRLRQAGRCYV